MWDTEQFVNVKIAKGLRENKTIDDLFEKYDGYHISLSLNKKSSVDLLNDKPAGTYLFRKYLPEEDVVVSPYPVLLIMSYTHSPREFYSCVSNKNCIEYVSHIDIHLDDLINCADHPEKLAKRKMIEKDLSPILLSPSDENNKLINVIKQSVNENKIYQYIQGREQFENYLKSNYTDQIICEISKALMDRMYYSGARWGYSQGDSEKHLANMDNITAHKYYKAYGWNEKLNTIILMDKIQKMELNQLTKELTLLSYDTKNKKENSFSFDFDDLIDFLYIAHQHMPTYLNKLIIEKNLGKPILIQPKILNFEFDDIVIGVAPAYGYSPQLWKKTTVKSQDENEPITRKFSCS